MKRFFASVFALVLLLAGATLAAAGGMALSVFGTGGAYEAPSKSLDSDAVSVAIIADLASVEVDIPFHEHLGEVTLSVRSPTGTEMFLGRAAQEQIDGYLFGQPYDLATQEDGWKTVFVPGVETSIAAPAGQTFWSEQSSGPEPSITLVPGAQDETLVLMNADATPGIGAVIWLGFAGERIFAYSVAAIAAGVVLIIFSVAILVRGFRRKRAPEIPTSSLTTNRDSEVAAQADHPAT